MVEYLAYQIKKGALKYEDVIDRFPEFAEQLAAELNISDVTE